MPTRYILPEASWLPPLSVGRTTVSSFDEFGFSFVARYQSCDIFGFRQKNGVDARRPSAIKSIATHFRPSCDVLCGFVGTPHENVSKMAATSLIVALHDNHLGPPVVRLSGTRRRPGGITRCWNLVACTGVGGSWQKAKGGVIAEDRGWWREGLWEEKISTSSHVLDVEKIRPYKVIP